VRQDTIIESLYFGKGWLCPGSIVRGSVIRHYDTHDVDEAVLLSDRVVMVTNGPAATIGKIMEVKFERLRSRVEFTLVK